MDNQHRKINGYRELGAVDIALMNDIKSLGPQIEALCARVTRHLIEQQEAAVRAAGIAENRRLENAEPHHWVRLGATHLQQGLMALTRAVAQPEFF